MDKNKVAITAKRMAEARAALIRDNPFFGYLSLHLQLTCAPCSTAATDGSRLYFDPEFAEKLKSDREMEFVILHEILHCVLEHCTRRGTRDQNLYNIACDIVVNSTILHMWGLTTMKVADFEPMHLAPDGREGHEYNAEEVYDMLLRQSPPSPNAKASGSPGTQIDNHDIWDAIRDSGELQDKWTRNVIKASGQCGLGSDLNEMPPIIRKIMDQLLQRSKEDWKQILHDFIQYDEYDYSFLPPDRRFSAGDFFLPAFNIDEEQGSANDIWVCIDTSGSISQKQLREILAEVQDAMRQANLTGSVSFFDTHITDPVPFSTEEEFREIIPTGGGGTSFHIIFRYLRENIYPELPRAILIFTDGYVLGWPDEADAMGVPVLWLIKKGCNTDAPWGRVVELQ